MALNYLDKAAWDAGVYRDKGNDDDTQQDTSSEDSGYSASGILSAAKNFLEHPFQGMGTVIAPNYTPRPLDDSVYSDIPGTPVASGQFGELEDESVRDERMKDSADYMAANWPRLYGGVVAADEGLANVVGGIQNAVGGGNGILDNVQKAEEGMQNYREQWNNEYGDSYFLNPNKFATDVGSGIGSTVPIMALSALMPGAAVAGGTRALTAALSRAGLGRLAMSKAGQALIADTVRSPISSLADSLSEYGTVVNDMMQSGMGEDEARRKAMPMFFKNMALDTLTVPLELGVMKGGKGIATGLLGRGAEEGIGKSLAKGAARTGMLAGASGLTEGYQEGAQNALENDVQGKRDGGWYNPFTWTNEDWEAARGGFVGGALMGIPGNVAAGFHPEAKQAPLSAESQEQAQSIKDTLSHGKPTGMSNAAYNAYIELANSGNPDLIKQAASSLESFQQSQEGSQESTDDAATEAYKDYETYDQKQEIENFLNNNTVEQIGGEGNFNWLMGVLGNGTPEEVQHAYDTVIAAEKATAEQEVKNRPARSGGSMSPNTGNAMVNIVIQAANDSGVDPRLGLAIAARESGGDDVNAISMPPPHDGVYGVMQAQEETVSNMGLDSQYPDWKTDPYQNAMVGMAILKAKIDGENGDVWAGVRDYDGAGEEAEQYRQLVKNNYDNMGDIGGGGGSATYDGLQLTLPDSDEFTDQSGNVGGLTEDTRMKLRVLDNLCYQKFGQHLIVSSSYREGDPNNHGAGVAFDVSGGIVDDPDARQWLEQAGPAVGLFVIPEYQGEAGAEFAHGDNVHFSNVEPGIYGQTRNAEGHWSEEHAAPSIQSILKGGASSGVSSKVAGDNGQFERELDQAAQEAKSDMDKIQAQSDQAMNEIMNDDSAEKTAQDAQQDAENAQKQAEESQQSAQDDVVPDVAQTIRDTSNNIDEINTLDGMFTKDSNGNDKFIDTPENRDFIKTNYKDEIAKAVNDAMSKEKAPSATSTPKSQQQTPHARLGRILATYDRKDPKFKEYMNTFRNGTEQEQRKLADDLQTTQELERANSLKGNPLTSQQGQNTPPNAPQQGVEAPEQPEQENTPAQVKESLETQKKRNAYLSKKQKLMERVPSGRTVKVHASTNDVGFDATYKIVPAGDITASHNTDYAVNDLYPAELQPRDRNRPQMRGQVEKMAKTMKPELLAESQFVNEGAPIVNNSGVVLNGNGRVMAIQKAYQGLTDAHKKSAEAYKDYLVSIAPSLGIAPEKVQSVDHPVLVRQAADDADTNAIINSTEGGAKLGGAEQAKADADRLKLSTLEQFVDNGTGEFMNPSNREFRRTAAKDIFSDAEGNSVFNAKGELSPIGALRIRNAIFAKAYKDDYLLTQLSEATDNNSKNIMNAMIAAAPEVAKVNEGIKEGNLYPDYDISDVITKTAKTIMSLRNEGKPLSFHLQETNLFSQGESEAERLVLEFIERNKFKSRTIADMYKAVCDRIFAVGSPKQSKSFDSTEATRISLENIISNAIQEVEHGQSLFDTAEEKPAEKAVSEVPDNRQAEPAGSGRVHQQEAGRVQSQEKEGNEVDEKSKQSDHVDTEPQQTESKDTEGTHAEEGSQGDLQEEISKFHDLLNSKKSTPRQVVDAYKRITDAVIANAKENYSKATAGEKIIADNRDGAISGYKISDVFIKRRLQREITAVYDNAHKELRAITESAGKEEIKNDADIRFGTVEDAEKAVMKAFGIKPHKKPADTPAVPHETSTKAAPKKAVKKAVIKDNDKIEKTFHLLDDSDEALEAEKKAILEELSHLSANPAFNPVLMYHLLKVGAIHVQRGLNEFARWAKAMKDTLPQSEPFLHSVWDSLQSMPNHAKLDEKQLTAAIRYVGSLYDHGMTDKVDLRKSFIATLGVKNAKYFDAVYNAVMEYPSIEELKGANDNVNSNVPELVARSGEGASENAVGESRIQGGTAMRGSRQDTAPAGKGPEEPGMGHDSVPGSSTATGRTAGNRRVQTQESKDSTGSTGSTELPGSVRAGLERVPDDDQRRPAELVRVAQNRPQHEDPVNKVQEEQKDKHLNEIKKALPMLLPQQAEDVCIAEDRFKEHSGMMFTNGTGTGKTYTGLGIVKRFVDANKKNILIIAPSDGILKQWEEAATKDFGITLTRLNSTKDAGKDAVTATYANVGANQALVNRDFDLVITDESHNLMGSESAKPTDALQLVRAVTGNKDGFNRYHHDKHPEISSKIDKALEEIKKLRKRDSQIDKERKETHDPSLNDESRKIRDKIEKLEEEMSKWHEKMEAFKGADEKAFAEKQPSKVLFLSATPFQYVADLDYANGYLFDYADYGSMEQQGYNQANGRENFYMENFGYKMRYNRLERPGSDVDTDLMEREFNRKMVESGAMHGRMLSSAYDYDRGFIRVDAGIGKKIDEGFDWLRDQPRYSELNDFLRGRFTGQQKYYLLEAIKAKQAIPLIKEYIKEGKKVVIFHNFNKGGADNPFAISREGMDHLERLDSELADHILEQYHEFQAERPDLADLDLNDLESPIETLSKAFGDELVLYNGTLSKGEREKNKNSFNNDDSKTKIILVQSAAGQAGVSLHDTTGKHQRALINLGLPTRPSEAIQQEGRIYRVGNKSNAIFRYLNTGTYMEQMAFATKLAERAGTVENIALGEMARSLKQAYVEAFEESQEGDGWKKYLPGSKTEGTGGKANDYRQEQATDFDRAKAVYFGKQKKNSRTKSQEGHDYFATPEPVGYKMVQWLQSKPGQSLLEPSAGDGAIARWMPDNTYNTVVEPSRDLTPKLMRNVAGAKVVESTFENFDLHNKFDGIAMNPPFGHGGKTAVEHVAKAYQHLKDGGRLIAIIPDGSACQKHFDKWFYGDPEAKRKADRGIADGVLMADIHLPSVTFDRAGTNVNTRMVVIDKYTDEGTRQVAEAEARGRIDIAADDVSELFDRIEGMDMPERLDMSDEKKQTSIRKAGQQLTRSKEDLKAEIKEAFPNAKEIKDEGERMTFTMPNGSHIVVDMKNEIVLTDKELAQAKKDHHIDNNGNVVVEGYAQLHGKDAYMALSQGSHENTGFHEAYHLAEGAVLTDREKAAIKKAIPDAEKRADKYAEWVEARKHGRGTAWGKLFQKIKDFAMKMKKIFTGAETVNDVFRQIESGEVWERQSNSKDNQARYSIRQTQDSGQEEAPVKPQDIIDAINDIVHIYEGSRLTDKERKELRESSKFDPDHKQADRPQATDLYDRHAHAGFNRMGYFNLSNYGRILALHLDNVMNLKGNLELTNKVLDRQDKNAAENKMNGVSERLTPSQARQNAVMDFGAMMIRNPELARETYPAYAKIFDEGLEKHQDLKEQLDRVIQLNETYQGQTAAERAAGSIAREREKVQLRKHPKEWLHTHFDKFYTNWVDDKHIFSKIVAKAEAELGRKLAYDYDVHKQAQMALNVASSRALLFLTGGKSTEDTYKVLNTVYGHAITKNVTMKDIMDALNKVSKEDVSKTGAENAYDALGNYLIAMRTEELEKHYHDAYARSAGFDEEGTREIIQNTPESIKKIAQMYWDINTNIVNILQQQGLISKGLAGKLRKYKHYCPMYRDMSDGIADMDEMIGTIGAFNKGGGYANVNNGIKRIEGGGKRPILDPITSLSQMAVSMISKCERNDVAKTFVKLGQDFSGLGDIVVRDPTLKHADPTAFAFTVWQNGEQVVYRTTPEIYDALTNNDAQENRLTIKIASGIAQTLRTGATISPSFIVRNLLRDTMSATVNSKTGFYLPLVDNVRGAWKLHFDKKFSAEYHASGASMSTYMRADADSSRDLTKELLGHKYDSYPVVVKQVRQLISWAWHEYEKFGNLIEDSTRAGEFRRARNQGLSIDQAGQLAREITLDFSRHGKKGQIVNKYVPFFNATIQGTDKFIRTFKDNPMRAILSTVIWIILPSLGLWAINHDDDWYKELDENTKYTNWTIPLPGGTHLLIPKPQEVGILFGSGIEAVLNQMTGADPHGMKEWARQYAEAMTPSLYPAVVRPLIEWMTNYSFWTGRNLVPASLQKAPSEMQFTSYTSELAKAIGDTWIAKSIKLSPIAIDNWISGWFGSAGRFVANMLNDPISYVRGNSRPSEPAKYWYEMPVIGSFIRQNGQNSEYVNRMYEIQKDMNDDYERSDAGKQRKGKKASSSKPKDLKQVDTAVSSVSKLNKEIKAIRNDPKKDPDQKRREIDQRRTKINDLAKKVVLKFDK
ncbi:LPD38 domain-containing protein [Megasphaera sp.]|uniref:LPD38 domain-containing protein n=1 Tax=Megasphaera sp. TaxID=2023260 RepID=UPI00307DC2DB